MTIQDTFLPVYYNISIAVGAMGGADPDDGFIDHQKPTDFDAFPTLLADGLAKERGNMRYENLIKQLSDTIAPTTITNETATGADEDTAATVFSLTVKYERDEYIRTEDELNLGTFLTGVTAVQRFAARACIQDTTSNREIYDPSTLGSPSIIIGPAIRSVNAGDLTTSLATAEGNITVIAVDLTT